jgi:type IV pilus assembly protein PilY1
MKMSNLIKVYRVSLRMALRVWAALTLVLAATSVPASDLSIYQPSRNGQVTMLMMLDTSQSMDSTSVISDFGYSISEFNKACKNAVNGGTPSTYSTTTDSYSGNGFRLKVPPAVVNGQQLPELIFNYCLAPTATIGAKCVDSAKYINVVAPSAVLAANALSGGIGTYCFIRIARLKMGMMGLLINNNPPVQNTIMGMGHYPGPDQTLSNNGTKPDDAEVLVPAALLGPVSTDTVSSNASSQRYILAKMIAELNINNATPTASAYAEAAAYLLGNKAADSSLTYAKKYGLLGAGGVSILTNQGAAIDRNDPVVAGTTYKSPVVENAATTCGQGIYILSDGQPTNPGRTRAELDMKAALGLGSTFSCPAIATSVTGTTPLTNTVLSGKLTYLPDGSVTRGNAWECMGEFAQALNNSKGVASDGNKYSIQTAFVAFGAVFDNFRVGDATSGTPFVSATTGATGSNYYDATNACSLASRPGTGDPCASNIPDVSTANPKGGYGSGGFYIATTPQQVSASVEGFIQTLASGKVTPLTTGSASIPVDSLNQSGFQPYAYLRALSPNPAEKNVMSWDGNIKKYAVNSDGIIVDKNGNYVFQTTGALVGVNTTTGAITPSTKDLWNTSTLADGGLVVDTATNKASGTLNKIPKPTTTSTNTAVSSQTLRNLFIDVDSTTGGDLSATGANKPPLLKVRPAATPFTDTDVLNMFKTVAPFNALSTTSTSTSSTGGLSTTTSNIITPDIQVLLLNYLGYELPLGTPLPASASALTGAISSTNYLGGSLHSQPISVTYSGSVDANGNLLPNRTQSLLYGSMDGGIHLVDDSTDSNGASLAAGGVETMVFVPNEILTNKVAAQALKQGVNNNLTLTTPQLGQKTYVAPVPSQGVDGHWVADPTYKTTTTSGGGGTIEASQMNVYGGLRMGGSSFYGLDITTCATASDCKPKLLFKISPASGSPFNTMGQSWSRPVLTNIRLANKITRVMIVGGGYDLCYENPRFKVGKEAPDESDLPDCKNASSAAGNSVYVVNAKTGEPIWTFTSTSQCTGSKCTGNSNMVDSVVSPIGIIDRDNDGLTDLLYFADLGGKVYRADLNNKFGTTAANLGVRVTMLADLATTSTGAEIANGDAPRFYEQPNITFYKQGSNAFYLVNVASGDRSNPLDVLSPQNGGPKVSLPTRPVNNVYGIIDTDATRPDLMTGSFTFAALKLSDLLRNPQTNGGSSLYSGVVSSLFKPAGGTYGGWYRSLSANYLGAEQAGKKAGGKKAFEKPLAIEDYLIVPVYDPEGTSVPSPSACSPRVVGQTDSQTFCLPYGVCTTTTGTVNFTAESKTGSRADPVASRTLMGPGIRGVTLVSPAPCTGSTCPTTPTTASCSDLDITNNQSTLGSFSCQTKLIPTRWYEKLPNPNLVK